MSKQPVLDLARVPANEVDSTTVWSICGWVLLLLGALLTGYAVFMSISPDGSVVNMSLMQAQLVFLLIGLTLFLAGIACLICNSVLWMLGHIALRR